MAKDINCLFLLAGIYWIILNFRYFCYCLKIEIYGQRCEDIPWGSPP